MRSLTHRRARCSSSRVFALIMALVVPLILTACGGDDDENSAQIEWTTGTPPAQVAAGLPSSTGQATDVAPETSPLPTQAVASTSGEPQATNQLTPDQRVALQPNELGQIPILEYHNFTDDPDEEAQFTRTIEDFRGDLEWLYEHDFYVVPLRDVLLNQIKAPAGKHPVALTFDDSSVGQFRYLINDDGSVEIDPNSAVGVMEAFYAEHPDFGRGGHFAVLPRNCFYGQETTAEEDQIEYCGQKLTWLLANGYEVGNHTLDHMNLHDVTNEEFKEQIGGAIEALQAMEPNVKADILTLPNGSYPGNGENERQMAMLENGFTYNGREFTLLGSLMVGANPTVSPVSIDWETVAVPRIQVFDDAEEWGSSAYWFGIFEDSPEMLYTSDGDPNAITLPTDQPPALDGTFDPDKADGKAVIRYDPETGAEA